MQSSCREATPTDRKRPLEVPVRRGRPLEVPVRRGTPQEIPVYRDSGRDRRIQKRTPTTRRKFGIVRVSSGAGNAAHDGNVPDSANIVL
jgi:hypothetical protein